MYFIYVQSARYFRCTDLGHLFVIFNIFYKTNVTQNTILAGCLKKRSLIHSLPGKNEFSINTWFCSSKKFQGLKFGVKRFLIAKTFLTYILVILFLHFKALKLKIMTSGIFLTEVLFFSQNYFFLQKWPNLAI